MFNTDFFAAVLYSANDIQKIYKYNFFLVGQLILGLCRLSKVTKLLHTLSRIISNEVTINWKQIQEAVVALLFLI